MHTTFPHRRLLCLCLCVLLLVLSCTVSMAAEDTDVFPGEYLVRNVLTQRNPILGVSHIDPAKHGVTVSVAIPDYYDATYQLWFQSAVTENARLLRTFRAGRSINVTFENLPAGQYVYLSATVGPHLERDTVPPFTRNFSSAAMLAIGIDADGKALPSYLVSAFTQTAFTVIALDPNEGTQIPLAKAEISLTSGSPVSTIPGKEDRIRSYELKQATPYRVVISRADQDETLPVLLRTAKNYRMRPSLNEMQKLWWRYEGEAYALLDQLYNGFQSGQDVDAWLSKADSFLNRFSQDFPDGKFPTQHGEKEKIPDVLSAVQEQKAALAPDAPTSQEQITALYAQTNALKPVLQELQRLVKQRIGSTQAWKDYLSPALIETMIEKLYRVSVDDIEIFVDELGSDGSAKVPLQVLLDSLEGEIIAMQERLQNVCADDHRSYIIEPLYEDLKTLRKDVAALQKAAAKSRSNLSKVISDEDTKLNLLIKTYVASLSQDETGVFRVLPGGAADFSAPSF